MDISSSVIVVVFVSRVAVYQASVSSSYDGPSGNLSVRLSDDSNATEIWASNFQVEIMMKHCWRVFIGTPCRIRSGSLSRIHATFLWSI